MANNTNGSAFPNLESMEGSVMMQLRGTEIDARNSQGFLHQPAGPVDQTWNYGNQTWNYGVTDAPPPNHAQIVSYLREVCDKLAAAITLPVLGVSSAPAKAYAPETETLVAPPNSSVPRSDRTTASEAQLGRLEALPINVCSRTDSNAPLQELGPAVQHIFERARSAKLIQRLAVLGDVGMGKTVALKRLLYGRAQAARVELAATSGSTAAAPDEPAAMSVVIPLYIPLLDLRADGDLVRPVQNAFNAYAKKPIKLGSAAQLLEEGQCLLLLDGLDELDHDTRASNIHVLCSFIEAHPQHQYVITCRTANYRRQLGSANVLELAELRDQQVEQVLGDQEYDRLSKSVAKLARCPGVLRLLIHLGDQVDRETTKGKLLRQMAAWQFPDSKGSDLPQVGGVDVEVLRAVLKQIAVTMVLNGRERIGDRALMEIIETYRSRWHEACTWRQILRALSNTGDGVGFMIFDEPQRQWQFEQRSMLAYFAAEAVVENSSILDSMVPLGDKVQIRETLGIYIGLIERPGDILLAFVDDNPLLAAHCHQLASLPLISDSILHALVDALCELLRSPDAEQRMEAAELLADRERVLCRDRSGATQALFTALGREWRSDVFVALARALHSLADEAPPKEQPPKAAEHYDPHLRSTIELWRSYGERPNTLQQQQAIVKHLVTCMNNTCPTRTRHQRAVAAVALGSIAGMQQSSPPETSAKQVERASLDKLVQHARKALLATMTERQLDDFIGWCATDALALQKHSALEAEARMLYQAATNKHDWHAPVRPRVIYLLGRIGSEEASITILHDALANDVSSAVRGRAAEALGRLNPPNARAELEHALQDEKNCTDPWTARQIVEALGRIGTHGSIPFLQHYLWSDSVHVRRRARQAIANIECRYQ